jgi:hypothetical protein
MSTYPYGQTGKWNNFYERKEGKVEKAKRRNVVWDMDWVVQG